MRFLILLALLMTLNNCQRSKPDSNRVFRHRIRTRRAELIYAAE
jgi:hypothetical protein